MHIRQKKRKLHFGRKQARTPRQTHFLVNRFWILLGSYYHRTVHVPLLQNMLSGENMKFAWSKRVTQSGGGERIELKQLYGAMSQNEMAWIADEANDPNNSYQSRVIQNELEDYSKQNISFGNFDEMKSCWFLFGIPNNANIRIHRILVAFDFLWHPRAYYGSLFPFFLLCYFCWLFLAI